MKNTTKIRSRLLSLLLVLVLLLGLVPTAALANSTAPDTIKLTKSTFIGPNNSAAVSGNINDMVFDMAGSSVIGMCSEREKGMGWSLEGHTWNTPTAVNDPVVKTIMAYFYCHTLGVFTDQAAALKLDQIWGAGADPDYDRLDAGSYLARNGGPAVRSGSGVCGRANECLQHIRRYKLHQH